MDKFSARSARWVALAVLAAASQLTAQTAVHADDMTVGKKVVVLGDSFTADPPYRTDLPAGCYRGPNSWPNQLAASTGIAGTDDFLDESCNGASINTGNNYNMTVQSKLAADAGAFGPRTQLVAVQAGIAEIWRDGTNPYLDYVHDGKCNGVGGDDDACTNSDHSWQSDAGTLSGAGYSDRLGKIIDYVRYNAPNAQIVLVGYPQEVAPGTQTLCARVAEVPGGTVPRQNSAMAEYLDILDSAQRDAAQQLGIDFLDVRALTAGHDGCAADPWVAGATEVGTDDELHPLDGANTAVANALADRVAGN